MATLADIRRRIASMKNTQQITRAMQAVAASKLRKAQARAQAARPYAERMEQVLSEVAERVSGTPHPFLSRRTVRKRLLIRSTGSFASGLPPSKCVASVEARCPPAENPTIPIRSGSSCHSPARARRVRSARAASCSGAGWW